MINFETSPERYKHWKLKVAGSVATLTMDVQEDVTLAEGYKLKLNSYDLGVDIELADAIQRLAFRAPASEGRRRYQSQAAHLLRRRQYLYARHFFTRVQS